MQPIEVGALSALGEQQQETSTSAIGILAHTESSVSPSSQQEQCIHRVEHVLWTPQLFREKGRGDPPEVTQRGHARDLNLSFDANMVSFVPASWRDLRTVRLHLCITLHPMSDN